MTSPRILTSPKGDEKKVSYIPVFIENSRELAKFPLERGAATRAYELINAIAKKMKIPHTVITLKVHRVKIENGLRLCTLPDGTVVQVHINSETWDQMDLSPSRGGGGGGQQQPNSSRSINANTSSSGGSFVQNTSPINSSRTNVTAMNTSRSDAAAIMNQSAPTKVKDVKSLREWNKSEKYAGTQANVELDMTSDNKSNANTNDNDSSVTDPNASVNLAQPGPKNKFITVKIANEGCKPTNVTVDNSTNIADLRIRCNVSPDDYPTVSCNGRRILIEEYSFKEQAIGNEAKIVFHTKQPYQWDDGEGGSGASASGGSSAEFLSANRLVRSSGGYTVPLNSSNVHAAEKVLSSPTRTTRAVTNTNPNSNTSFNTSATSPARSYHNEQDQQQQQHPSVSRLHNSIVGMPSPIRANNNNTNITSTQPSSAATPYHHYYQNPNTSELRLSPTSLSRQNVNSSYQQQQHSGQHHHQSSNISPPRSPRVRDPNASTAAAASATSFTSSPSRAQSQFRKRQQAGGGGTRGIVEKDAPSNKNWIAPTPVRDKDYQTDEYQLATYGTNIDIRFEDPTDDGFTHDLRVWSLNPVGSLFTFAGLDAEDRYHLLCDGTIVLYAHHTFAMITKGVHGCLFSFALKG